MENKIYTDNNHKWYQGWKNIVTLVSLLLPIWPIQIFFVWMLADWDKRAKTTVTIVYILPALGVVLGGIAIFPSSDFEFASQLMKGGVILEFGGVGVLLLTGLFLSIFREKVGKSLPEIWIPLIIGIAIIFAIAAFLMMQSIKIQYEIIS